jgi:ABC-type transport system involved in multi-copper enzyme maturation permease subunit
VIAALKLVALAVWLAISGLLAFIVAGAIYLGRGLVAEPSLKGDLVTAGVLAIVFASWVYTTVFFIRSEWPKRQS